jgi:hypothetical protein
MNRLLIAATLAVISAPVFAADVGVSISVGQPGLYGQIDVGNVPPPEVVYSQPVIVEPGPYYEEAPPIYLHVPPGYERHWSRHCRRYNACDRRVFFVRDRWYNQVYVPRYREREGYGDERYYERRHEYRDERGGERRDEDHGGDRYGHGYGHDRE